jgi:probable DNA repair protein
VPAVADGKRADAAVNLPPEIDAAVREARPILVANAQRGSALKWAAARAAAARGDRVWLTPRTFTFDEWVERSLHDSALWAARTSTADRLLTRREEWAVFRAIAAELSTDYNFVNAAHLATELLRAVTLMDEWEIAQPLTKAERSLPEYRLLDEARRRADTVYTKLKARPARHWWQHVVAHEAPVNLIEFRRLVPARRRVLQRLRIPLHTPTGGAPAAGDAFTLPDFDAECVAAAEWCRERLAANPTARLLLVAPDLAARRAGLDRALSQALEPLHWLGSDATQRAFSIEGGKALAEFGRIAHALDTLRLLTTGLSFEELSHWLREPFMAAPDDGARARIELELRQSGGLHWGVSEVASKVRRAKSRMPESAASFADLLLRASEQLAGRRASAGVWAERFGQVMRDVWGRHADPDGSEAFQIAQRWIQLLADMSALSATVGPLDARGATALLSDLASDIRYDVASSDVPVTVTNGAHDPITPYDGIWAMGLDADTFPTTPSAHPLVPWLRQRDAGVLGVSAASCLADAAAALTAWRVHADELRLSAPRSRDGSPMSPSMLLAPWSVTARARNSSASLAHAQRGAAPSETYADERGSPWPRDEPVAGGVRSIELQSACGFRAYAELRLHAAALETPTPGVHPLDRGNWLHKALFLFWSKHPSHAKISALTDDALDRAAFEAVEGAYREAREGFRSTASEPTLQRESRRLAQLVATAARAERERPPFSVVAREEARELTLAGARYRLRIDRIDRLDSGELAIVDYKSGKAAKVDWIGDRPTAPQLLVYWRTEPAESVGALALLHLTTQRAEWAGAARVAGLPKLNGPGVRRGAFSAKSADAWADASARWPNVLDALAGDYANGVASAAPRAEVECKHCHLTVLCRRTELAIGLDAQEIADDTDDSDARESNDD